MSRFRHTLKSFALLACLTLLLATIGCEDGSVLAPVDGPGGAMIEPDFIGIASAPSDPALFSQVKTKASLISAESGGTISNERVTLDFSPGALDEDTYITMTMVDKSNLVVEFSPEGIHFNEPVIMTMKLEGTVAEEKGNVAVIKWYNPSTDTWDAIENIPTNHPNKAMAVLEHFSKYGAEVGG